MAKKNTNIVNFWYVFAIFKPITSTKTLSSYFHLVEEFLSLKIHSDIYVCFGSAVTDIKFK